MIASDHQRLSPVCPPRRRPGALGLALLGLLLASLCRLASAQGSGISFSAQADQTQVNVGEPILFTITLQYSGGQVGDQPTVPDFGGLQVRSGPMSNRQISYNSTSGAEFVLSYQWQLVAPREGSFTIAPSVIRINGQTYQSTPITITAKTEQLANVPPDLQGEPIVSASTDDAQVNQQLKGRLFLHATVSNKNPYVGEPVIITYTLYNDRVPLSRLAKVPGDIQVALREELFDAQSVNYQTVDRGGHQYQAAAMYRVAITPTKAGRLAVNGYAMQGQLQVNRRRSSGPFDDPFGQMDSMMNDPFFGGGLKVELPSPPIQLNVRPIPADGQPPNYNGTVGDFTVQASADRAKASEDDLVTLKLTVTGKGAIELANPPSLPANSDFEVVGQSHKVKKEIGQEGIGGNKTFELVLRPKRAGHLAVPAIPYPVFNPYTQAFVSQETRPIEVAVVAGKNSTAVAANPADGSAGQADTLRRELNYIKPLAELRPWSSERMLNTPAFWALHLAAFSLMALAWRRKRQLTHLDPARIRREGAWRTFQRRVGTVRQQSAQGGSPQETAGHLEHATRALIADRYNLSADGLTRPEIERILLDHAVPRDRVQRLCDLLDECAALRYAPAGAANGEFSAWTEELVGLAKECVRE